MPETLCSEMCRAFEKGLKGKVFTDGTNRYKAVSITPETDLKNKPTGKLNLNVIQLDYGNQPGVYAIDRELLERLKLVE